MSLQREDWPKGKANYIADASAPSSHVLVLSRASRRVESLLLESGYANRHPGMSLLVHCGNSQGRAVIEAGLNIA